VFTVNRGGNFSEAGVNKLFGLLKVGLTLKLVCLWTGIGMSVLLTIVLALLIVRYRNTTAKPVDEEELLISMQEEHQEGPPVGLEEEKVNSVDDAV